jgi:hypothetical protein
VACTVAVLLLNWRLRLWLKKPEVAEFNRQSRCACVRACAPLPDALTDVPPAPHLSLDSLG